MSRSNKVALTLWLVIVLLPGTRAVYPQPPNETLARISGADLVVVDVSHLMKSYEPLQAEMREIRKAEEEAAQKLIDDIWKLEGLRSQVSDATSSDTHRQRRADLRKQAMTIYSESLAVARQLRLRQAQAHADAYSEIQREIQELQQEHRIGVVLNRGAPVEVPKLTFSPDSDRGSRIGFSPERESVWWTFPGAVNWYRYELDPPQSSHPGDVPTEPNPKLIRGPNTLDLPPAPPEVQSPFNQQVIAFSPDLDITHIIQKRLAKAMKNPRHAEPGVGADSR